jgi:hypothetical protein
VGIVQKVDENALQPTLRLVPRNADGTDAEAVICFPNPLAIGPITCRTRTITAKRAKREIEISVPVPLSADQKGANPAGTRGCNKKVAIMHSSSALNSFANSQQRRKDSATIQQDNTGPADFVKQFLSTRWNLKQNQFEKESLRGRHIKLIQSSSMVKASAMLYRNPLEGFKIVSRGVMGCSFRSSLLYGVVYFVNFRGYLDRIDRSRLSSKTYISSDYMLQSFFKFRHLTLLMGSTLNLNPLLAAM